jgi:hypothetical protein
MRISTYTQPCAHMYKQSTYSILLAAVSAWFGLVTVACYTLGTLSTCNILFLEYVGVDMFLKQCTRFGIKKARSLGKQKFLELALYKYIDMIKQAHGS